MVFGARPFALLAVLLAAWPTLDPALVEPLGPLASDPERVTATFTRCGRGRGHACVIDGDTFKIGERKIRIIGIDAPEVKGSCPQEIELAEKSNARLQSLLNDGPFIMTGRIGDVQDRYGRDLRALSRERPDGSTESIAEDMRSSGLAHRYVGFKTSWC
jgi:endonuclease YncB( thermonuclease family)